ncbi:HAD family hydrolase [Streptomyces sp. 8L]|uniref:HAD family hydrolase n=1 Tax=Streptomyces sp. 8L TaxID=2877242 RepID=UPI001CD2A661|nr:HAD family phosphatase [Streptomyces sp. 8L]MCA1220972.1 HAD family phosphatase [Streptomyces sp. 8L]
MTVSRPPLLDWFPEAVVFDCDGTLMDSERHWQEARHRAFRDFGLHAPPGFAEQAAGVHYTECGRLMAASANKPELAADLAGSLLDHFLSLVADDPVTMPGAAELVRSLSGRLPLAVASNCPLHVVEECLQRAGLRRHLQHIVVPDEEPGPAVREDAGDTGTVRPKPWPDVYLVAARLCGVSPSRALAVEDSLTGVESAHRAGLRVLGVGPRPEGGTVERADLWLPSLRAPELLAWAGSQVPGARTRGAPAAGPSRITGPAEEQHGGASGRVRKEQRKQSG